MWSTGTATGQWHRDGVPISGQTGLTYTYNAATDDGTYLTVVETNGAATATSNALIAGENTVVYSTQFTGTDGTNLNGFESWDVVGLSGTLADTSLRILSNDVAIHSSTGRFYRKNAGSNNHISKLTIARNSGDNVASSIRMVVARGGGTQQNLLYLLVQNSGWSLYKYISSVEGVLQSFVSRTLADGDTAELRVNGNYVQVWFNGVQTSQSLAQNGGLGWDVSDVPAGQYCGIRPLTATGGAQSSYPFKYAKGFEVSAIPANAITISTIAAEEISGSPGQQRIRLTGIFTGSITQLQPLVLSSTGDVLLDWENVAGISGSSFDVVTDALPIAAQSDTVSVWLRDETNVETATSSTVAVPVIASVGATNIGMNEEFWDAWSTSDVVKDHGQRGAWVQSTYADIPLANLDAATMLPASYPGATTSVINKLVEGGMCKAGDYDITYPSGMTATAATLVDASVVNAFSAGAGRVNIAEDIGATCQVRLSGTIPAGGAWITMKPTGDPTPANPFTDQVLSDYNALGGTGPIRFMTAQGINTSLAYPYNAVDAITATNNVTSRACTVEMMVALCNATGRDMWWCCHRLADPTYVAQQAAFIAANLAPTLKVYPEWSNEVWNGDFIQAGWSSWRGCAEGLYNTNGDAAPSSPSYNRDDDHFTASTGYPLRTFATGERVVGNLEGTGLCMWEALQAVPIGATGVLPASGSNSYWTRIASPTEAQRARRRFQMARSIMVFDAFDAAFAAEGYSARSRVVRVLGIWALDSTAGIMERLDWQSGYQKTDMVAAAFYVGGGGVTAPLGPYATDHITGWGATEKARYNTNLPLWLTDIFAALNAETGPTIDAAVTMKNSLEATLRAAPYNLAPNSIELGQYECGQHVALKNYPDANAARTAFAAYRADARMGLWWDTYLDALKDRLGGTHCIFSMVSQNTWLSGWGIMFQQGDQTTEQFEAVSGWIAANT